MSIQLSPQLPNVRSLSEYQATHRTLLSKAESVSKTDADTDYREDFVKTQHDEGSLQVQLSTGQASISQGQWDHFDNYLSTRTSFEEEGSLMHVTESSTLLYPEMSQDHTLGGLARTLTFDVETGGLVGTTQSSYDPKSGHWA